LKKGSNALFLFYADCLRGVAKYGIFFVRGRLTKGIGDERKNQKKKGGNYFSVALKKRESLKIKINGTNISASIHRQIHTFAL